MAPPVTPTAPAGRVAAQMRAAYDYNAAVDAQVQAGKFTPASAPYADGTTSLEDLKTMSQRHGIPIASVPSTLSAASNGGTYGNPALNSLVPAPSRVIAGSPAEAALALNNVAAADRQAPLDTAPGSSRIVRDANPDPNPVVNRATDARGNTTTTFANGTTATSSNAPTGDGGIYVDGRPVAHGADGNLVADLSRAGGGTTPAQRQAPATAIAGGATSALPPAGSLFQPNAYRNTALNAIASGAQGSTPPPATAPLFHPEQTPPAFRGVVAGADAESNAPTFSARFVDDDDPAQAPPAAAPAAPPPVTPPTAPALAATVTPPGAPPPSGPPPPVNLPSATNPAADQPFAPQPLTLAGTATPGPTIPPPPVEDEEERRRRLAAQ